MKEKVIISTNFDKEGLSITQVVRNSAEELKDGGYVIDSVIAHSSVVESFLNSEGVSEGISLSLSPDAQDTHLYASFGINVSNVDKVPESVVVILSKEKDSVENQGFHKVKVSGIDSMLVAYENGAPDSNSVLSEVLGSFHPNLDPGEPTDIEESVRIIQVSKSDLVFYI